MASCRVSNPVHSDDPTAVPQDLAAVRAFIDPLLEQRLELSDEAPPRLIAALRHALLAPGKRLRPALVLHATRACGGRWEDAAPAAIAVEMIHAYSLVHDDLPAMDDDDLRRGRPTCHRAFDEATAILCGDALQALAFQTLAEGLPGAVFPSAVAGRACGVLARAAGPEALVGGQADDLAAERGWLAEQHAWGSHPDTATVAERLAWTERINRRKTGALFLASLELGGLAAAATADQLATLASYGRCFGTAFQIADDLLDTEGDEKAMGKRVGKDHGRGKVTAPGVLGPTAARERAAALAMEAARAAASLGPEAGELQRLALWIVARDH